MDEASKDYILKKISYFLSEFHFINSTEFINGGIKVELDDGQKGLIGWKEDLM